MKSEKLFLFLVGIFLSIGAFSQNKHTDNSNWLIDLPDSVSIGDINLPGSHDAAAINKHKHTPYACHFTTIPEQLDEGIRILDIRIKVKGHSPDYSFVTCHGKAFGGNMKFNEYQSLQSVLDECTLFLKKNPSEFVVMLLKVDDVGGDKTIDISLLDSVLYSSNHPIYNTSDSNLPTLGKIRGKIYLVNRIDNFSNKLGVPVEFPLNKSELVPPVRFQPIIEPDTNHPGVITRMTTLRSYPIFIQDQYEKLRAPAEKSKFGLYKETIEKKKKGDCSVVLNYATARQGFMFLSKAYIQDSLLNYFGNNRPTTFGWTMLDYEAQAFKTDKYDSLDVVKVIISSNFQYKEYPEKFKVLHKQDAQ